MAASNFKRSLALVLAHEGGYVNHPLDPGGATNQGVTQAVYDAYRTYHKQKIQSVKLISSLEVSEIYQKNYWKLCRADSLPCGLDYAVFDFAVNSGVSRAVRYLQRTVNVVQDGVIGVITLAAIEAAAELDEQKLIIQYCANRMAFLQSLGTFKTFGRGWTRRVLGSKTGVQESDNGVIDFAVKMALDDPVFSLPTPVGSKMDEIPAKAVANIDPEITVVAPIIDTAELLKNLAVSNDMLAQRIN